MQRAFLATLLLVLPACIGAARAQDAEAGKQVFKSICNLCHEATEGKNRVGPSLYGVVGRRSGAMPGFTYSAVVAQGGVVWTEANLDSWITAPQTFMPGNRMTYSGLKDDKKRHNVIAYLKTLHH